MPALTLASCSTLAPVSSAPSADAAGFVFLVDGHFRVRIDVDMDRASRRAGIDIVTSLERQLRAIDAVLPGPAPTIWVSGDTSGAIPEIGIGGSTYPTSGDVILSVDPSPGRDLAAITRDWLPRTLAHELHHSRRITRGPGYGRTLGEALVTEGLADQFAREVFPTSPVSPWVGALDRPAQRTSWAAARPLHAMHTSGAHSRWFFGAGDQPRWAGYTIGYAIVSSFLGTHPGITAASLVDAPASRILAESGHDP